jgi:hypothetical protein
MLHVDDGVYRHRREQISATKSPDWHGESPNRQPWERSKLRTHGARSEGSQENQKPVIGFKVVLATEIWRSLLSFSFEGVGLASDLDPFPLLLFRFKNPEGQIVRKMHRLHDDLLAWGSLAEQVICTQALSLPCSISSPVILSCHQSARLHRHQHRLLSLYLHHYLERVS